MCINLESLLKPKFFNKGKSKTQLTGVRVSLRVFAYFYNLKQYRVENLKIPLLLY